MANNRVINEAIFQIRENGESWIEATLASMDSEEFVWICFECEKGEVAWKKNFPDPKEYEWGISEILNAMKVVVKVVEEHSEVHVIIPIMEYYRDRYGSVKGWMQFAGALKKAHEYKVRQGELASGSQPKVGKSGGCASMIVFGVTAAGLLCWGVREVVL
tara:strand:- start:791 stop:1270 length:480 start_codon:yes stop_codon:yes gene_type:complete